MEDTSRNLSTLKDEQQVRQRPGVIFGTNDEKGAFQGADEVVANSIDEAREGYGSHIIVTVEKYDIITVEDDGRGLPMDYNEKEGKYNWELALCTLYASGKYDSSMYGSSLGLNGLGLTATQYASSFMEVWSTYGGKTRYMSFTKGRPDGEMQILPPIKEGTGTKIKFQPDPEVFPALSHVHLSADMFLIHLRQQAMLIKGLCIELRHYELKSAVKFYFKNGAAEYIDSILDNKMLKETVEFSDTDEGTDDDFKYPEKYKVSMYVAFNFTRAAADDNNNEDGQGGVVVGAKEIYHNGSYLFEGGSTVSGFESGITQVFTDKAREIGKIQKTEKFIYKDIADILVCIAQTEAPGYRTWFKNQTKGAIGNPFIGFAFKKFIINKLSFWMEQNKDVAARIIQEVVNNKTAREEGAEVSKKVIKQLSAGSGFGSRVKGFKDCRTKIISKKEIYLVEGKSALGSVKLACDPEFQAVLALRGKPINCLKERITRVLSNDTIVEVFRILQCGLEVKSEFVKDLPKFDINKLNWGKIIICTDADVDGMHIRCLSLVMFYVLAPSLLKAGKVYIAETPLYDISYGKQAYFAYDDTEKEQILAKLEADGAVKSKIKIQRSKGLGENDVDMMSISTMNPDTRRLIQVQYPENDAQLIATLNALLGDDLSTRRLIIDEYFDSVDDLAE